MACHHCTMMSEYYSAREAQEQRAEQYSAGYTTEQAEFYELIEPRITFKQWLMSGNRASANV